MPLILIADDNQANRYLLASLFREHGHDVASAAHGAEALTLALESPPDLIVSDILMPVLDGFELCRRCKSHERLRAVPFVFYTGSFTGARDERLALDLGAVRFVTKPQKPETLTRIVHDVLAEARAGRLAAARPLGEEMEVLRQYNEALFRKLEAKVARLRAEIVERERAQKALQDSQIQLLHAHRLAHIGIWSRDSVSESMAWSEELYHIAGLDPDQLAPSYSEHARILTPESWKRLDAAVQRTLRTAEPYELELELVRPDGTRRRIHSLGGAKCDGTGQVVGLYGTIQDVTERVQADEKLRLTNLLLATQMEASIDGIVVEDGCGKVLRVNARFLEMWGLTAGTFTSGSDQLLQPAVLEAVKDPPSIEAKVLHLREARHESSRDEVELCNGKTFDCYSAPMFDDRGQYVGRVWGFRDITDRKQAEEMRRKLEEQLRVSQKMEAIGSLAGGVAHDFNNLLSVILGHAGFALDATDDDDPVREDLLEVKKAGERAGALTRQLLAFSRKQVLRPEPLDLNGIAAGIERMLRRIIGEDIEMSLVLAPDLGLAMADPGQIEQVIMNLVVNARDAMPGGGRLTIETANLDLDEAHAQTHVSVGPGPFVQLAVTDSGCGMDAATQARIFEPFFTTKERGKGTGLGLSTVYGIVTQSGGAVGVHSEPGRGTTFKVFLPRVMGAAATRQGQAAALPARSTGNETILVVEDEDSLRNVTVRMLRSAGYAVMEAASGEEALRIGQQYRGEIHLLMTDVVMPQMSGRVLVERLQKTRPSIGVLYMSGYTDDAIVHNGVLDPGKHFISKPFGVAELTRRIRIVLDGPASTASDRSDRLDHEGA